MGVAGGDGAELGEASVTMGSEELRRGDRNRIGVYAAVGVADDPLAEPAWVDANARGDDVTGDVGALDPRELDVATPPACPGVVIPAGARVDVRVVDAGGANVDQELVPTWPGDGEVLAILETFVSAVAREDHARHAGRQRCDLRHVGLRRRDTHPLPSP